jgi:hypothetical protein
MSNRDKRKILINRLVLLVVALGVFSLCYKGVIPWRSLYSRAVGSFSKTQRGVKQDLKGAPVGSIGAAGRCRRNLQTILGAKREASADKGVGANVSWEEVQAKLAERGVVKRLRCPTGASYELMPVGTNPRCPVGANNTSDPLDDHIFKE